MKIVRTEPWARPNPMESRVMFYESAGYTSRKLEPLFVAGMFPAPQFGVGRAAVFDLDFTFPPCAGQVESKGRLSYIDGCTSSLLLCPPRKGDPCINHLHVAPGVTQTEHHHPSARMGMVVRGSGTAVYQDSEGRHQETLCEGSAWIIPAFERHWFKTSASSMDILVLHPDSAWGPDDDSHQMLDATLI